MKDYQTLYYIPGYNSGESSETFQNLKKDFPDIKILLYDFNDPTKSVNDMVQKIIDSETFPVIVASSFGGWFAERIAKIIPADLILYNPCLDPMNVLKQFGVLEHILNKYDRIDSISSGYNNRSIVVCRDDDIVNPKNAIELYEDTTHFVTTLGGHKMTADNMKYIKGIINYSLSQYN